MDIVIRSGCVCGVVRSTMKMLRDSMSNEARGILFETLVFHELNAYMSYQGIGGELFYWRTSDGAEIDFIWKRASQVIAIEVKSSTRWREEFNAGFKSLCSSKITISACYGIYQGEEMLKKDFGLVLPWQVFLERLYAGKILPLD